MEIGEKRSSVRKCLGMEDYYAGENLKETSPHCATHTLVDALSMHGRAGTWILERKPCPAEPHVKRPYMMVI